MAINLPSILPPVTSGAVLTPVPAVAAVLPAALLGAGDSALPLPVTQPLSASAAAPDAEHGAAPDAAAMRPDQVILARQLSYPTQRGESLAASWRSMVRIRASYAGQLEQQARSGHLSAAILAVLAESRDGREPGQPNQHPPAHADWRLTVHAAGREVHTLQLIADEDEQPRRQRHRVRAALRLALTLAEGYQVIVQIEPTPAGLLVEMCAPDRDGIAALREWQPELELVLGRAGLRVLEWRFRDALPSGRMHGQAALEQAGHTLGLPVFRALAELALALPAVPGLNPALRASPADAS